jgi:preprotein translocase subunit SecA
MGYYTRVPIAGYQIPFASISSELLVNNLVEIGIGEGKSVVLAITACVFALIGLDVHCSCYSEILSMRDKNNFISIFRALEIEERITYDTFNKLCEQLSNEQCNVREKVHDMI